MSVHCSASVIVVCILFGTGRLESKCTGLIRRLILFSNCHLRRKLHTYGMMQSPSWEANWCVTSQEIPRISRNPKVHYRTHNRPPPVSILGQPNPVHILTSHLLEININIIHPSTPRSPQWSPSLRFPQQDPIHPRLLTHTRHMPNPLYRDGFFTSLCTGKDFIAT